MPIQSVSAKQLSVWVNNNEVELIDVREPAEHATTTIAGSLLVPLGAITASDLPQTDKKLVLFCQKGLRGESACKKVASPEQVVFNLEGGLTAWIEAGYDTISSGKKVLPLDRQVQLCIGATVLTSSLLAYFYQPAFLWLSAFFGAGLTFAGATGFCGLAKVMAKMPWNNVAA